MARFGVAHNVVPHDELNALINVVHGWVTFKEEKGGVSVGCYSSLYCINEEMVETMVSKIEITRSLVLAIKVITAVTIATGW